MKSIDNLREYALTAASVNATTRAVLAGYVDEIEREVKELTDERDMLKTQWEAGVDFDQRLEACVDKREDVTLWGVDYTALPLDADGEPIHVGDVMEWRYGNGEFEVIGIGGETLFYIDKDSNECEWTSIDCKHHHHAPTVEDVLREFAERLDEIGSEDDCVGEAEQECRACIRRDIAAAYAEYAAKLRLVGDE